MSRPRNDGGLDLPKYMQEKHGAYYYVYKGKWQRLSDNLLDAKVMLEKIRAGTASPTRHASGLMMMPELIEKGYAENLPTELCKQTVRQYAIAKKMLCAVFANVAVEQFDSSHVSELRRIYVKKKTPGTFNTMFSVMRHVVAYALEIKKMRYSPLAGIKHIPSNKRDRYINDAEWRTLYDAANEVQQIVMELLYRTGQRVGDVLDFKNEQIAEEGIFVTQGKTKQKVLLLWTPELRTAVERAQRFSAANVRGNPKGYLIVGRDGGRRCYKAFWRSWDRLRNRLGFTGKLSANIHDIRARCATDLARDHGIEAASATLGHKDLKTTDIYVREMLYKTATGPTSGGANPNLRMVKRGTPQQQKAA